MPAYHQRHVVLSVTLALFASACGDSYEPTEPGHFTAVIRGDVRRDIEGQASYRGDLLSEGAGNAFLLTQFDGADRPVHSVGLYRWTDEPITPGTYRVIVGDEPDMRNDDFSATVTLDATGVTGPYACSAQEGSVRIAHASARRIEGTFELSGSCTFGSARPSAIRFEAQGSFTAIPEAFSLLAGHASGG